MAAKGKYLVHNGEKHTIYGWAKKYNLSYKYLWSKVTGEGMTIAEALAAVKPKPPIKTVMFRGREYTVTQLSELCGIDRETLNQRIFRLGWDIEEACTKPKRGSVRYVVPVIDRCGCKRYDCLYQDGSGKCQLGVRSEHEKCDKYYDAYEYYYGNEIKWTKKNAGKDPWAKERKRLIG